MTTIDGDIHPAEKRKWLKDPRVRAAKAEMRDSINRGIPFSDASARFDEKVKKVRKEMGLL